MTPGASKKSQSCEIWRQKSQSGNPAVHAHMGEVKKIHLTWASQRAKLKCFSSEKGGQQHVRDEHGLGLKAMLAGSGL